MPTGSPKQPFNQSQGYLDRKDRKLNADFVYKNYIQPFDYGTTPMVRQLGPNFVPAPDQNKKPDGTVIGTPVNPGRTKKSDMEILSGGAIPRSGSASRTLLG